MPKQVSEEAEHILADPFRKQSKAQEPVKSIYQDSMNQPEESHRLDARPGDRMEELRQKADASKSKYMQENGVDENLDPVKPSPSPDLERMKKARAKQMAEDAVYDR